MMPNIYRPVIHPTRTHMYDVFFSIHTNRLIWWSFYLLSSNRLIWETLRTYIPKWPIDLLAHRRADFVSISWEGLLKKRMKNRKHTKNKNKLLWNPIILTRNRGIIICTITHIHTQSGLYRRVLYKGFPYKQREGSHISLESNTCFTNKRLRLTNSWFWIALQR